MKDILNSFNLNILYFYIDLLNFSKIKNKKELLNKIIYIINNNNYDITLYFINIIKLNLYNYKTLILNDNNIIFNDELLEHINNIFINIIYNQNIFNYKVHFKDIYNTLNIKNKTIIFNYIKIFVILCDKYYFSL